MRSIRVRLLLMLLFLVTFVISGLSWYVYEQTKFLLQAKELATAELLRTQAQKQAKDYRDEFYERMIHQAERLGRQVYERVELSPVLPVLSRLQYSQLLTTISASVNSPVAAGMVHGTISPSLTLYDPRISFSLFSKRTIVVQERALDGDEYFHIWTPRSSIKSANLPVDCFARYSSREQPMALYEPEVQEEVLQCGKRFCMVSLKMPIAYESLVTGSMMIGRPMPRRTSNTATVRNPVTMPRPNTTMVVQIARTTDARDKKLSGIKEDMDRELEALHQESEEVRKDTLNRLILICLATISLSALAITWLSRSSLAPLVNVADAVSNLTPKDLRLKLNGTELDHRKMPEELAPIVLRLQESLESLENAFAREKRATADISHELRTPLASLMTTMQVALRKPRTTDEYKSTLKQCIETGSHMHMLVERLLVLSRLDAGVDHLKQEPVEIVELAGQCVDMLRPLADQRHISVELDVDESASVLEPMLSDAAKLREIMVNLIDNAVHYNKDNGSVTVKVSAAPKSVILEVTDTGVGMSPEIRSHLFERFFRADPSRQSETVNAGLGLAIVKGYVDLFGGLISVTSVPESGSTFRLTLPRKSAVRIPEKV